ncbi:MAG: hypothetical protein KAT00_15395 [Planctomycetes bacterium]|nr:hypothetical protein [Planctomycetota bacterium]
MLENLAAKGIKRKIGPPVADVETCKHHRPIDVGKLIVVAGAFGLETGAVFMNGVVPDWLVSAYRDMPADSSVNNSPHYYACAFDVMVGSVMKQIEFVKLAVVDAGLFNRGGIYVGRNTCHIDTCDDEWMRKHNGAKFWIWHKGKYYGFADFKQAAHYTLGIVTNGGSA